MSTPPLGVSRKALADLTRMAMADMLRARRRWDEPPGLHFMYRHGDTVRVSPRSLVENFMWASADPASVLSTLARSMCEQPYREVLVTLAPDDFYGVAFRCETWMVATPLDDEVAVRRVERVARRRQLSRHPDRIEQRTVWAMTRLGLFTAFQTRGRAGIDTRRCEQMEGSIPDALVSMYRAIVSETAPLPPGFGGPPRGDMAARSGRPR